MGRFYYCAFEDIAVTAAQDIWEIAPPDDKPIVIHWVHLSQHSDTDSEGLRIAIRRLTAAVTSGNGTAVTPRKQASADPAATFTAERNGTTRATTSGTNELLIAAGINVLSGWDWLPIPELRPVFVQGEACIIGLEEAPLDSLDMNSFVIVEELG